MRPWLAIPLALLGLAPAPQSAPGPESVAAVDPFTRAVMAYRAERHAEALQGFRALVAAAGEAASPQLLGNLALAALRERRPAEAEPPARKLLASKLSGERSLGRFLLGQASFERARLAEMAARLPDAEPGIWQSAVDAAEQARAHWLAAARERDGWPEAVRNAERAARQLEELRAERDAAEQQSQSEQAPEPPPPAPATDEQERPPEVTMEPLSAAELQRLRERLQQKEREKRQLRRTTNRVRQVGERGW